jgi:hypothetical protein
MKMRFAGFLMFAILTVSYPTDLIALHLQILITSHQFPLRQNCQAMKMVIESMSMGQSRIMILTFIQIQH